MTAMITNGFFTVDKEWIVLYWNKAAEKLLKKSAQDVVGKNLWKVFTDDLPFSFYDLYHEKILQDIPDHFCEFWEEKNAWFEVNTFYFNGVLSVSFKSSDKPSLPGRPAHPRLQLKLINEIYRLVLEVTNDCLWEWDLLSREQFWMDGGHRKIFGYPIENTIVPQDFWESLVHPEDKEKLLAGLNTFVQQGLPGIWEAEYRFQRADGEYAHVYGRGHLLFDDNGRAIRMIGATQDMTSRKTAELQLLQSERNLALVAKQTINAVVITDPQQRIIWVNNAFTGISGYDLEEVNGREAGDFLHGKDTCEETKAYLQKQMKSLEPFDCTILHYSKSGASHWVHMQGQALLDEYGKCERFFSIQTDVTEKKMLEQVLADERIDRQKEMTHAVLVAQERERSSIGREMHDNLNQILGAAKLYIELARTDESQYDECLEKATSYLMEVMQEIRKISKALVPPVLVLGLLDSIKVLVDDLVLVDAIEIELENMHVAEQLINEKLQVAVFRIVQEQLNNIIKHAHASHALIRIEQTAKEISLSITDDGVGCALSGQKDGIGLMNIRTRAELAGGRSTIVAAPGKGFGLKVVFPLG